MSLRGDRKPTRRVRGGLALINNSHFSSSALADLKIGSPLINGAAMQNVARKLTPADRAQYHHLRRRDGSEV